mmetsp:Transcript_107669/g.170006  ORF Transcript_107669/g.170006 Transcript_107669/m.170006 type:complete len:274 (+) Transcript_107669:79-900(+)
MSSGAVSSILIVAAVLMSLIICLYLCRHVLAWDIRITAQTETKGKSLRKSDTDDVETARSSTARSSVQTASEVEAVVDRVDDALVRLAALGEAPVHISHLGIEQERQRSDPRDKGFRRLSHVSTDSNLQERGANSKRGRSPSPLVALGLAPGSPRLPGRYERSSSRDQTDGRSERSQSTRDGDFASRQFGTQSLELPGLVRSPRCPPRHANSAQGLEHVSESKTQDNVVKLESERRRSSLEAGTRLQHRGGSGLSPATSEKGRRSRSPSPRYR